ncbi:MAG: TPM domain-containing protein [Bacteroidota bacterium]|nr:TPM domain-containing protein [Bacteroidota bacterium]MDP4229948.1 TPM domain-containing protein [Bacteroidota bacterium]MDP4235639.1 TPM domain-containing protein [Bacteroidota bacterium]
MKRFFSLGLILLLCYCPNATRAQVHSDGDSIKREFTFPEQVGWVNDFENDLDSLTIQQLTTLFSDHEEKTTDQIVVVTIADFKPYTSLTDYALALANYWKVGQVKKNNGVLIALTKAGRNVRIATGSGMEEKLTDAMCKKIIDEKMIPQFKKGNYGRGLLDGSKEIVRILEKN